MPTLTLYSDYTRERVHEIFSPDTTFTPQAGTWGLQGIVRVPERNGDFVFFVTYGQEQGEHVFDEGITEDGVLTWQSQPSQGFESQQIQQLIAHDAQRERPVYFQWQILDWGLPPQELQHMGLTLLPRIAGALEPAPPPVGGLVRTDPPIPHEPTGVPTNQFRKGTKVDYPDRDARNRILGLAGERMVIELERQALIEAGRVDLALRVRDVSGIEGDGAGYDIESYNTDGGAKYIEVKTTRGPATSAFFMSANELRFAEAHPGSYHLYRVYDYNETRNSGHFYEETRNIQQVFELTPMQFRAKLRHQEPTQNLRTILKNPPKTRQNPL